MVYEAESPDEAALVNGAKAFGFILYRRSLSLTSETVDVEIAGRLQTFEVIITMRRFVEKKET